MCGIFCLFFREVCSLETYRMASNSSPEVGNHRNCIHLILLFPPPSKPHSNISFSPHYKLNEAGVLCPISQELETRDQVRETGT